VKYFMLIPALLVALTLSACDKPKTQTTPAGEPVTVPLPDMPKQPGDQGEKPAQTNPAPADSAPTN
jgi:hypothetical protein